MIEKLIAFSARNAFIVVLLMIGITGGGIWAIRNTPIDAIPDLSDAQVIVTANWEGRSPTLVEDQVTYPIVTALISAPNVKVVRGFSYFDVSFVYIIFEDGTDPYWARSRVLEYLNGLQGRLPAGVTHDMVRAFVDIRKTNYPLSETDFANLVNGIETALNARPPALTEGYLFVTKEISINHLGQFDSSRFESAMKKAWPHHGAFSVNEKKLIKDTTTVVWR